MAEELKVNDGKVVSMHYTLHVDGKVVDSSEGGQPLQFIQGMGHIIPGLEHELYDMEVGQSKNITVPAKQGYGETDENAFMDVPREAFPENVPLEKGTELELRDQSGNPVFARRQRDTGADPPGYEPSAGWQGAAFRRQDRGRAAGNRRRSLARPRARRSPASVTSKTQVDKRDGGQGLWSLPAVLHAGNG